MRKVADDAPLIDRIEYVLMSEVNPMLAGHGGKVTLVELTDDKLAILQFGGGCNGCSMVDYTLKGDREAVAGEIPGRAQRRQGCHRAPARRPLLLLICPLRQRKGPWRLFR